MSFLAFFLSCLCFWSNSVSFWSYASLYSWYLKPPAVFWAGYFKVLKKLIEAHMICKFWRLQTFDIFAWSTLLKHQKNAVINFHMFWIATKKNLESANATELLNASFEYELFHTLNEFRSPFFCKLQKKSWITQKEKRFADAFVQYEAFMLNAFFLFNH